MYAVLQAQTIKKFKNKRNPETKSHTHNDNSKKEIKINKTFKKGRLMKQLLIFFKPSKFDYKWNAMK